MSNITSSCMWAYNCSTHYIHAWMTHIPLRLIKPRPIMTYLVCASKSSSSRTWIRWRRPVAGWFLWNDRASTWPMLSKPSIKSFVIEVRCQRDVGQKYKFWDPFQSRACLCIAISYSFHVHMNCMYSCISYVHIHVQSRLRWNLVTDCGLRCPYLCVSLTVGFNASKHQWQCFDGTLGFIDNASMEH